ncbi:hypothetical protein Tco_0403263 [Tanacetum coccineum]
MVAELPQTLEYRGDQLNAAPVLEVETFTNWKKRQENLTVTRAVSAVPDISGGRAVVEVVVEMVVTEYQECDLEESQGEHPRYCQEKGSKVEETLVHLKMVVKFKVLIEKKKMCSLSLMRFDWWMDFLMVHLEELEMKRFEEDEDEKESGKDGIFN